MSYFSKPSSIQMDHLVNHFQMDHHHPQMDLSISITTIGMATIIVATAIMAITINSSSTDCYSNYNFIGFDSLIYS